LTCPQIYARKVGYTVPAIAIFRHRALFRDDLIWPTNGIYYGLWRPINETHCSKRPT
jgi:hypothetical protein